MYYIQLNTMSAKTFYDIGLGDDVRALKNELGLVST